MDNKSEKIEKTIIYAIKNYYRQTVTVDENLTDDEILKLWKNDEIEGASELEPYDSIFDGDIIEAFIAK